MPTSVLVVEDDRDSLEVLSEFLELHEIEVVGMGEDGWQAANLYKKHKPDLVLLDVMMPNYDGFYALNKIKEENPDAKVVFVTAATSSTTQKELFESNVSAIVFKPFEMDHLFEVIQRVLKGERIIPKSVRARKHNS